MERVFEVVHCPSKDEAEMHNKVQPDQPNQLCELDAESEGQYLIPKLLSTVILPA